MLLFKFKKLNTFLVVLLLLQAGRAMAYSEVPALIHLNIEKQSDTFGFNLVAEIPSFIYKNIIDGKITLWDSPKKQIKITPQALQSIELQSNTKFYSSENLFMNELWSSSNKKTLFAIIGFSFLNENEKGKISYGYVDFSEAFAVLASSKIRCNVNGPAELTYVEALFSRRYHYNLVQFGNKNFNNNPEESIKIKQKAQNKKISGQFFFPKTKEISYIIDIESDNKKSPGNIFIKGFEDFLNKNREEFFNLGGNKYYDYQTYKSELVVTRVEVTEVWTKTNKGIEYSVKHIQLFVNNKPLNPISLEQLHAYELLFYFKSPEDYCKEKQFSFHLSKVNGIYISETDAPKFMRAINEYSWTQVSRFVKFAE